MPRLLQDRCQTRRAGRRPGAVARCPEWAARPSLVGAAGDGGHRRDQLRGADRLHDVRDERGALAVEERLALGRGPLRLFVEAGVVDGDAGLAGDASTDARTAR